jgi:hypothetical protein
MTTVEHSSPGDRLVRRDPARAVPFVLAVRKPNRPLPIVSLRVPVTPANRNYLRELRDAELRAWQNTGSARRRSSTLDVVSNERHGQRDLYAFGLIVALTLALAAVLLAQSPSTSQRLAHWVNIVRHAIV